MTSSEPAAHARLSPSAAGRWSRCPASVQHIEALAAAGEIPQDVAGREAAVGTAFHHFIAKCIEEDIDPVDLMGEKHEVRFQESGKEVTEEFELDEEMFSHLVKGLEWFEARRLEREWDIFVERRLDLSDILAPGQFGTLDLGMVGREDPILLVNDWKYGAGVPVSPCENTQAIIYAAGLWEHHAPDWMRDMDPEKVTIDLHIFQPRCPGGGGGWQISKAGLDERMADIRKAAERALGDSPEFNPGEPQCKFCPAARKGRCKAFDEWAFDTMSAEFDDEDILALPRPEFMSDEEVVKVLKSAPLIRQWLDALHARLYEKLMHGEDVPGARLVVGRRPPRRFDSSRLAEAVAVAEALLGPDAVALKPESISVLERRFGKEAVSEVLGEFIVQGQPKPVVSFDENDNRQPYTPAVAEFDDADVL